MSERERLYVIASNLSVSTLSDAEKIEPSIIPLLLLKASKRDDMVELSFGAVERVLVNIRGLIDVVTDAERFIRQ